MQPSSYAGLVVKLGREGEDERTVVLGKSLEQGLGKFIHEDGCSPAWSRGPVRKDVA